MIAVDDVRLARDGDRSAWLRLVRSTKNLVSSIALSTVSDVSASEDISQEVFLQAWLGLQRLRSPDSFLPWLRQLTRNRSQSFLRDRYRDGVAPDALDLVDPAPDPQAALLSREEQAHLVRALDGLPAEAREVLVLFYREGQSVAQVAGLLELSEEAVRKRLSRARGLLRDELAEELFTRSAPSESFCATVMAALPTTTGTSSGAGLLVSLMKGLASKAALAGLGGAVLGGVLGVAGASRGFSTELALALDEPERRLVRRLRAVSIGLVVLFSSGALLAALVGFGSYIIWGGLLYVVVMAAIVLWPLRLHAQREARELVTTTDPEEVRRRYRHLRWKSVGGLVVGLGSAVGTLLWLVLRR